MTGIGVWANIILMCLQVANAIMTWRKEQQLIKQGEDQAIARHAAMVLGNTEAAKLIARQVDALSDADLDQALRDLESDSMGKS